MPISILETQQRLMEAGRIRLGQQVATKTGGKRPAALDVFRLTSPDRARIAEVAKLYGGTVTTWEAPSGQQFEVVTKTDRLPVIVPPSAMAFSQYFELWSAGGCQRRCDSVTELLSDQPCMCDPENRQCQPHTRLSVMLSNVKGLGLWRLDTQGVYAALELKGAVDIIELAAGRGQMLPATLRLEQREIKRPDEPTKKFVVPVLDIDVSPAELLGGTISVEPVMAPRPVLTPVPEGPRPGSIAQQVMAAENLPSRRRAEPIQPTGITPRTAAQREPPPPDEEDQGLFSTADEPRMATKNQLTKLAILLRRQGFDDDSPEGKQARMDWCKAALNIDRELTSSKDLTFNEADTLIDLLEEQEKTDAAVAKIIELYKDVKHITDEGDILDDITLFLQREQPLATLHGLTGDERTAVLDWLRKQPA